MISSSSSVPLLYGYDSPRAAGLFTTSPPSVPPQRYYPALPPSPTSPPQHHHALPVRVPAPRRPPSSPLGPPGRRASVPRTTRSGYGVVGMDQRRAASPRHGHRSNGREGEGDDQRPAFGRQAGSSPRRERLSDGIKDRKRRVVTPDIVPSLATGPSPPLPPPMARLPSSAGVATPSTPVVECSGVVAEGEMSLPFGAWEEEVAEQPPAVVGTEEGRRAERALSRAVSRSGSVSGARSRSGSLTRAAKSSGRTVMALEIPPRDEPLESAYPTPPIHHPHSPSPSLSNSTAPSSSPPSCTTSHAHNPLLHYAHTGFPFPADRAPADLDRLRELVVPGDAARGRNGARRQQGGRRRSSSRGGAVHGTKEGRGEAVVEGGRKAEAPQNDEGGYISFASLNVPPPSPPPSPAPVAAGTAKASKKGWWGR